MRCEAIIFDLDGALADTLEDLTDALNFGLSLFGLPRGVWRRYERGAFGRRYWRTKEQRSAGRVVTHFLGPAVFAAVVSSQGASPVKASAEVVSGIGSRDKCASRRYFSCGRRHNGYGNGEGSGYPRHGGKMGLRRGLSCQPPPYFLSLLETFFSHTSYRYKGDTMFLAYPKLFDFVT